MATDKVEEWMVQAGAKAAYAIGGVGYSWAQQRDRVARIIAAHAPKREDQPQALLARLYALLVASVRDEPGHAEVNIRLRHAAATVETAGQILDGTFGVEPIRRGDVVQIVDEKVDLSCRNYTFVVTDVSPFGLWGFDAERPIALEWCIRIGRAKFYPDGTPVED